MVRVSSPIIEKTELMAWFALAIAVLANVVANVSLKLAVRTAFAESTEHPVIGILVQSWTWIGVCAAIILLGSYFVAIRDIGLGVSYAIVTSLALVLITIAAAFVFQQRLTLTIFVGMGLIALGIVVLVSAELAN